jgi:hypothetical protein
MPQAVSPNNMKNYAFTPIVHKSETGAPGTGTGSKMHPSEADLELQMINPSILEYILEPLVAPPCTDLIRYH